MKTKILVVEDEIIIADDLVSLLESKGYDVPEPALSYDEAIAAIKREQPDVVLLDVQLGDGKTGIDVAQFLNKEMDIPFVFLTSNSEENTVNDAVRVNPSAFLIKPFVFEEVFASIEIALQRKNTHPPESIFVNSGRDKVRIYLSDIIYIKSEDVYIEYHLSGGRKVIVRDSLRKALSSLNHSFVQIHKSRVVNMQYLTEVRSSCVVVNDEEMTVGEKYRKTFKAQFKEYSNA